MSEIIEWIMRLSDEVSEPLDNAAKSSERTRRAFDKLQKEESDLDKVMHRTANSAEQLDKKLKALRQHRDLIPDREVQKLGRVNGEIERLENRLTRIRTMGRGTVSGGRSGIGNVASGAISALPGMSAFTFLPPQLLAGLAVAGGLGALMNVGAKREFSRTQFTNEFGAKGSELMDMMRDQNPLLGDQVMEHGRTLRKSGYNNRQTSNVITRLGDVANGREAELSSLTALMAQIKEEGKLTEQTMQGLADNGFNPLIELADITGKSFEQLIKDMEKGKISAYDVTRALEQATSEGGRFFGNMANLSNTAHGNWKKLTDSIGDFFGDVGERLATDIMNVVNLAQWSMGDVEENRYTQAQYKPGSITESVLSGGTSYQEFKKKQSEPGPFESGMLDWLKKGDFQEDGTFQTPEQKLEAILAKRQEDKEQQEKINAVSGGGVRNVTITIGKMVETINNRFTSESGREVAEEMSMNLEEQMVRVLLSAAS